MSEELKVTEAEKILIESRGGYQTLFGNRKPIIITDLGFNNLLKIFGSPFKHKLQKRLEFDDYMKDILLPEIIDEAKLTYEDRIDTLNDTIFRIGYIERDVTQKQKKITEELALAEMFKTTASNLNNGYLSKFLKLNEVEMEWVDKEIKYKKEIQKLESEYKSKNDEFYLEKNATRKLEELHQRELTSKDETIKIQSENIKRLQEQVTDMNTKLIEIVKEIKPVIVQPEIITLPFNRK